MNPLQLQNKPIHLGLGATAVAEPDFTGLDWYDAYVERHADDGFEGRLVSMFTFDAPWDMWEVHPDGEEVVICVSGSITLHQEHADGSTAEVSLVAGQYVINPKGTWRTADVAESATCLFITPGHNTQHRDR